MGSRGSSSGITNNSLPSKHIEPQDYRDGSITNPEDDYAYVMAVLASSEGEKAYEISYNGGKAFAKIRTSGNDYVLDYLGSTGKGAGTEILRRVFNKANNDGKNVSWISDTDRTNTTNYYISLGLKDYVVSGKHAHNWNIPHKDLEKILKNWKK